MTSGTVVTMGLVLNLRNVVIPGVSLTLVTFVTVEVVVAMETVVTVGAS